MAKRVKACATGWIDTYKATVTIGNNNNENITIEFATETTPYPILRWDNTANKFLMSRQTDDTNFNGLVIGRKNAANANKFLQVAKQYEVATQATGSTLAEFELYLNGDSAAKNMDGLFVKTHTNQGNAGSLNEIISLGGYARNQSASGTVTNLYGSESAASVTNTSNTTLAVGALNQAQITELSLGGTASATISKAVGTNSVASIFSDASSGATLTLAKGVEASVDQNGPSGTTVTEGYGIDTQCVIGGAGSVTDFSGVLVKDANLTSSGTITGQLMGVEILAQTKGTTDNYGLWVGAASGGSGTNRSIHVNGGESYFNGHFKMQELASTPTIGTAGAQLDAYMKADKFVIQYKDAGGTARYFYLDLTTTANQSWIYSAAAP